MKGSHIRITLPARPVATGRRLFTSPCLDGIGRVQLAQPCKPGRKKARASQDVTRASFFSMCWHPSPSACSPSQRDGRRVRQPRRPAADQRSRKVRPETSPRRSSVRERAPGCWRRRCSFRRSVRPLPSEPHCQVHPGLRHAASGSVPSSACPRRRIGGKAMAIMRLQMPEPIIPPRPPSPPPKPGPDDMPLPEGTPPVKRPSAPKPWQMRVDAVLAVVREAGRGLSRSDPQYGAPHGSGGAGANGLRPPYRPKAGLSTRARSACPERSPRCTSISGSRPLQRWRLRRAAVHGRAFRHGRVSQLASCGPRSLMLEQHRQEECRHGVAWSQP